MNPENKIVTWLFNPFEYIAGTKALLIGFGAILLAGWIGAFTNTHFDGVLDIHSGAAAPLWFFLTEGFLAWVCLTGVLWIVGRIASKTPFRTVDLLGTQAMARWPTIILALLTLPSGYHRFIESLLQKMAKPSSDLNINPADAAIFVGVIALMIPVLCWMVYLMYKAYSVSCNLKGGKAIGTFIAGLIVAEIISKLAILGLITALGTAHASAKPTAESGTAKATAQQFVALMAKEDFKGASEMCDSAMKNAAPAPTLQEIWSELKKESGPFEEQVSARTTWALGYEPVIVTCKFQKQKVGLKVVIDKQNKVAGLWHVDPD